MTTPHCDNFYEPEDARRHISACFQFHSEAHHLALVRREEEKRRIKSLVAGASTFIPCDILEDHEIIVSRQVFTLLQLYFDLGPRRHVVEDKKQTGG